MKKLLVLCAYLLAATGLHAQSQSTEKTGQSAFKKYTCEKNVKTSCYKPCDRSARKQFSEGVTKKWNIGSAGFTIGAFDDRYANMTKEGMLSMAINLPNQAVNLSGYNNTTGSSEVMIMGGSIGGYVSLNPRNRDQSAYNFNQELRLGASVNIGREAMIQYTEDAGGVDSWDRNSVVYCLIENELVLSGAYLFRKRFGKRFSVYGGAGMNIGSTFDNLFLLIEDRNTTGGFESVTTEVNAKSSVYTRAYVQTGLSYHTKKRVSFNLEMQSGAGLQIVNGAANNTIAETCVGQLGVSYSFNK